MLYVAEFYVSYIFLHIILYCKRLLGMFIILCVRPPRSFFEGRGRFESKTLLSFYDNIINYRNKFIL